ncbi:hypothetical protein MTY_1697 [Moorella thermoacetica Y72]|uniref:Uncharacterized protein n=1 Tax=Moorella thermoacetica Y72 TaxID=1325331 RepID=A0A0S6UFY7_NEOTH|nr:hypothetical protein MTY_1697 [Moorella thermoacetica Y72]
MALAHPAPARDLPGNGPGTALHLAVDRSGILEYNINGGFPR